VEEWSYAKFPFLKKVGWKGMVYGADSGVYRVGPLARLNALDANVVGISVNDPWSNKSFAEKNGLSFPLLSDYNREVLKIYGVEAMDFGGLRGYTAAKRSVFILDGKGVVRYKWVSEDPGKEPNYVEIEKVLREIS
jgi:peroxiredoxin